MFGTYRPGWPRGTSVMGIKPRAVIGGIYCGAAGQINGQSRCRYSPPEATPGPLWASSAAGWTVGQLINSGSSECLLQRQISTLAVTSSSMWQMNYQCSLMKHF